MVEKTGSDKKNIKKTKVPRTPIPQQDPKIRARNFKEVALGYTEEDALLEASRCIQCKKPRCIKGCPVEIDIKEFIKLITEKKEEVIEFIG